MVIAQALSCLHHHNLTGHTLRSMLPLQYCQSMSMLGGADVVFRVSERE